MTNVSYAVGPRNDSQEYFSNISSALGAERQAKPSRSRGGVISPRERGEHRPFAPACVGCSHVFRKRPQGVVQTLSAAKQGEAERLCDGCPCVGAEEICGAPSPYPCRSVDNTVPLLHLAVPAQAGGIARSDIRVPELCEGGSPVGTRASAAFQTDQQTSQQANQARRN